MSVQPPENIEHFLQFVKRQAAFHHSKATQFADAHPPRSQKHTHYATEFENLAAFLTTLPRTSPSSGTGAAADLLAELNVSDIDRLNFTILDILKENGGKASLDQIMIGVYKKTGQILKRNKATNVVYNMKIKGLIHPIKGVKAAYSLTPGEEEDGSEEEVEPPEGGS
jgi:hypothetical protein